MLKKRRMPKQTWKAKRLPKKRQQAWKAQRYGSRRQPTRKPNPENLSKKQLLDAEGYRALHSRSTVQDIKDFLSNVSHAYGNESLFIHTEPIAYSSSNEKRQLKHLEQSQERNTFTSWTRKPLEGGSRCNLSPWFLRDMDGYLGSQDRRVLK
jgi:hypothetical protein